VYNKSSTRQDRLFDYRIPLHLVRILPAFHWMTIDQTVDSGRSDFRPIRPATSFASEAHRRCCWRATDAMALRVTADGQVSTLPQLANAWAPTGIALFRGDVSDLEFQHPETDDRNEMVPSVRKIMAEGRSVIIATVRRS
jgi:hypothetical protein